MPTTTRKTRRRALPLDEDRVVTAAFDVLEREGFDALTVRRIADHLGVRNPALYWHVAGKQQIVDGMARRMLDEVASATRAAGSADRLGWRGLLQASARSFRHVMRLHRDGARVLAAADISRSPMAALQADALDALGAAGFAERDALIGVVAVFDYTLGATFEEQEDPARSTTAKTGTAVFEGGLDLLLDGLATRARRGLIRPRGRRHPRSSGRPPRRSTRRREPGNGS